MSSPLSLRRSAESIMKEPGYIYVMVNPSMEGLVKIGKTTREPEFRAKELSQATGVATPFYVAFNIFVSDCHSAEEYVHAVLEHKGFRNTTNREFFQMPLSQAIEVLMNRRVLRMAPKPVRPRMSKLKNILVGKFSIKPSKSTTARGTRLKTRMRQFACYTEQRR